MGFLDLFFGRLHYKKQIIHYNKYKFEVEVADSFRKMMVGLMDHATLARNSGMLFIFKDSGMHGFWMMNMHFSIDIIWLDEDGKVVFISERAQPCSSLLTCRTITPNRDAKYVLELCSGTVFRLKINVGNRFKL